MRSGMGRFIDEKEIERRRPIYVTDLLRMTPGVMVVPSPYGGEDVLMRGGAGLGSGLCRPSLVVDGIRVANDPAFPINSLVGVNDVRTIEIYSRPAFVPGEFQSLSGCGAIIVWTGGRPH